MTKSTVSPLVAALVLALFPTTICAIRIGFSIFGGIGNGYYDMTDLNNHIGKVAQETHRNIDQISSGVNVRLEGKLLMLDRFGISIGYEHYWADTAAELADPPLTYKAPADVYLFGGSVKVLSLPTIFDVNAAVNYCHIKTTFGTNYLSDRRLREFKGSDNGYELTAEVVTNFIRPVEVGILLGYRVLKVGGLEDKFGNQPQYYYDNITGSFELDYSGAYFYLTAGIRL